MKELSNSLQVILLIGIFCFTACTVEVPSHVIQPHEMEDLLYDYHLMQAMAGDLKSNERYKRNLYEQYVFDKHHISEAEFDSSLVWYMRNPKELESIYKNLNTRLAAEKEALEASIPPGRRVRQTSPYGDSVNIWDDYRLFRLNTNPLSNKLVFKLSADSNYHAKDHFEWLVDALFLQDSTHSQAVMAMTAIYDDDTIGNSLPITGSGTHALTLHGDSSSQIKELIGHIYYYPIRNKEMADSLPMDTLATMRQPVLLLSDIKLMRYHHNDSISVETDSTDVQEADTTSTKTGTKEIKKSAVQKRLRNTKPIEPTRVQPPSDHADSKKVRFEPVR